MFVQNEAAVDGFRALRDLAESLAPDLLDEAHLTEAAETFRAVLRPAVLRSVVESGLAALADRRPPPTKNAPGRRLRIVDLPGARLEARIVAVGFPQASIVATLTRNTLIGNVGRTPFVVRRWFQPQPYPNDVFDPTKTLQQQPDLTLEPGNALALRAAYDAYEVVAEVHPAVLLSLAGAPIVPLSWQHRREDVRPIRLEPGRAWLFLREVLAFADAIGDASLLPALGEVGYHPSHFIRWAATKTALRLAPQTREETLQVLARDAHPQLRDAARRMLGAPETL